MPNLNDSKQTLGQQGRFQRETGSYRVVEDDVRANLPEYVTKPIWGSRQKVLDAFEEPLESVSTSQAYCPQDGSHD